MRFEDGMNQYEIGEALGVSQMQVSRVMRRGLAKLLEAVQGEESPDGKRTFSNDQAGSALSRRPRAQALEREHR